MEGSNILRNIPVYTEPQSKLLAQLKKKLIDSSLVEYGRLVKCFMAVMQNAYTFIERAIIQAARRC
jgi:hypothetical protein